jgi:hypothetical protein
MIQIAFVKKRRTQWSRVSAIDALLKRWRQQICGSAGSGFAGCSDSLFQQHSSFFWLVRSAYGSALAFGRSELNSYFAFPGFQQASAEFALTCFHPGLHS